MIDLKIEFDLPPPWKNLKFSKSNWNVVNCLVGPNGAGKSRFAEQLQGGLGGQRTCRFLRADRLAGMTRDFGGNTGHWESHRHKRGFQKSEFDALKIGAQQGGFGGDAFILLEEKLDLRIRLEAILSQVFGRDIRLEWDSGNLVPKAFHKHSGVEYKLHQEECHGIKELIVLLTHIYDDSHKYLIIDEPELNLHPQYQSFILSHINKVAASSGKLFFLITHSPFFIELKTPESLQSVLCFHSDFRVPSTFNDMTLVADEKLAFLLTRINTHHKQLFFADYPIFVEGIFDAQVFSAIQERRNVSMEGAGSCFIDVGGKEELVQYYRLSKAFGKSARYILDLDALFDRNFRSSAGNDQTIVETLTDTGLGTDLSRAIGQLETALSEIAIAIEGFQTANASIAGLKSFLEKAKIENGQPDHKKKRLAVLIQVEVNPAVFEGVVDNAKIRDVAAKRNQILESISSGGIQILKKGFLESYLPSYQASIFVAEDSQKRSSVTSELKFISDRSNSVDSLRTRFLGLWELLEKLPSAMDADFEKSVKIHVSNIIFQLQQGVMGGKIDSLADVAGYLGTTWKNTERVFELKDLTVRKVNERIEGFSGSMEIRDFWGLGKRVVKFDQTTVAGNPLSINLELVT